MKWNVKMWNGKCDDMRKILSASWSWQEFNEFLSAYCRHTDAYTDTVREFHRDREVNIISSRNSSTFHKFICLQLKHTEIIPTLIDANNVQIDDCDAKANLFNDFFCSTFTHDNNILPPFPSHVTAGSTLLDNILFTPASVSTKLKGLTKSTTLMPDFTSLTFNLGLILIREFQSRIKSAFPFHQLVLSWTAN